MQLLCGTGFLVRIMGSYLADVTPRDVKAILQLHELELQAQQCADRLSKMLDRQLEARGLVFCCQAP